MVCYAAFGTLAMRRGSELGCLSILPIALIYEMWHFLVSTRNNQSLVHSVMNQRQEMEAGSRFKLRRDPDNDIRNGTGASKEEAQDFCEEPMFCSANLETISCVVQIFSSNLTTNRPSIAKDDGLSAPATIEHSSFDCGRQSTCH
jgi:hypothetical protein